MQSILEHFGVANAKFSLYLALALENANALIDSNIIAIVKYKMVLVVNVYEKVMFLCTVLAKKTGKFCFCFCLWKERKKKSLICLAYDIYYPHLEWCELFSSENLIDLFTFVCLFWGSTSIWLQNRWADVVVVVHSSPPVGKKLKKSTKFQDAFLRS